MAKLKEIAFAVLFATCVLAPVAALRAENPMHVALDTDGVTIRKDNDVLLHYAYRDVPFKPCVRQLFTPSGINVLRDAPPDHLHHHALMYAIAVDGVNFWEEQKEPGREVHRSFSDVKVGEQGKSPDAGFTEQLDWINPRNKELMLKESRTIEACELNNVKATFLTWQSSFAVPPGKEFVTLSGSHYFGLGMRFLESMDTGGRFRNSAGEAGEVVRGDERLARAKWCAFSGLADGKPVTIVMFGDPDNVRNPTWWFTMTKPFAYLSATLNLYREPLKITSQEPLVLRYAVAVWDGNVEDSRIEQVYNQWITNK
ncbi:MAG: PmoA family protein [Sedimentisphaerales bacterium]